MGSNDGEGFVGRRWAALLASMAVLATACSGGEPEVERRLGLLADEPVASLVVLQTLVEVGDVPDPEAAFATGVTGQDLIVGEFVRTGNPGFAEINFVDGSQTRIDRNSVFAVTTLDGDASNLDVVVQLDVGRAWNNVNEERAGDGGYAVETPVGTAAVRGTQFDVDCRDPEGTGCVFTVITGEVEITTSSGQTVDLVEPQTRVTVAPDGTPGEIERVFLFDPTQTDPWAGPNRNLDGQGGSLAGAGERPIPAAPGEDEQAVPPDALTQIRPAGASLVFGEDTVAQRVVVGGPAQVGFGFRFCDGFTCGTPDNAVCVSNKWIPNFGSPGLRTVRIAPLPGHRLASATISLGPSPGTVSPVTTVGPNGGGSGPFAEGPTVEADGSLTFTIDQSADVPTLPIDPEFNRVCGLGEAERDAFVAQWGTGATITNATAVVDLVWEPVAPDALAQLAGAQQEISGDDAPVALTFPDSIGTVAPDLPLDDAEPFAIDQGPWADLLVAIAQDVELVAPAPPVTGTETDGEGTDRPRRAEPVVATTDPEDWVGGVVGERAARFTDLGDVPTALASALARLGIPVDPGTVATALLGRGAWQPGVGVSLRDQGIGTELADASWLGGEAVAPDDPLGGVLARHTSVLDAITGLRNGTPATWVVALGNESGQSTAWILVGYDPSSDRAVLHDPRRGLVDVNLPELLRATTGVLELSRTTAPSRLELL